MHTSKVAKSKRQFNTKTYLEFLEGSTHPYPSRCLDNYGIPLYLTSFLYWLGCKAQRSKKLRLKMPRSFVAMHFNRNVDTITRWIAEAEDLGFLKRHHKPCPLRKQVLDLEVIPMSVVYRKINDDALEQAFLKALRENLEPTLIPDNITPDLSLNLESNYITEESKLERALTGDVEKKDFCLWIWLLTQLGFNSSNFGGYFRHSIFPRLSLGDFERVLSCFAISQKSIHSPGAWLLASMEDMAGIPRTVKKALAVPVSRPGLIVQEHSEPMPESGGDLPPERKEEYDKARVAEIARLEALRQNHPTPSPAPKTITSKPPPLSVDTETRERMRTNSKNLMELLNVGNIGIRE